MTGIVLVVGVLVTFFMVKDTKLDKNYVKNEKGEIKRQKIKIEHDEEPKDDGSDIDLHIPEVVDGTLDFVKGLSLNCWDRTKLLLKQTWGALNGDIMTQFILYLSFVNHLMTAKIGTIVYLWLTKWSVKSGQPLI